MLFGLDGVEVGLIIVFVCLFGGILSGFPVAFAIGGAGIISFGIIAALDSAGLMIHQAIDTSSQAYRDLVNSGVKNDTISLFRYPDLPRVAESVFPAGWETALDRNVSFIVNRMNERVLAGQSIETLLAVLMFVLMGITLERSKIANDLLTTMARVFGPLPGGLAVSIVVVGAFLAASTGIVGATVVTMGLLALPTMLRNNYSPEIATGVIAASGTLGQIIPPSIVIVLLGTLAGDLYSAAQEARATSVGCTDALTYLGEPAVVSVGTLFQAALLPGIMLALLYALYAFGYALLNPDKAPAVPMGATNSEPVTRGEAFTWFAGAPVLLIVGTIVLGNLGVIGSQNTTVSSFSEIGDAASLRTNVGDECKAAMIELHGQEAWDAAIQQQVDIDASGGIKASEKLSDEAFAEKQAAKVAAAAPIGTGVAILLVLLSLFLTTGRGVSPSAESRPLIIGGIGVVLAVLVDIVLVSPLTSPGATVVLMAIPFALIMYGVVYATGLCSKNELIRVVFPPLVLIVAVLGSILGGITNPTPAAALGAGGAIMLAAYRKLRDQDRSPKVIIWSTLAIIVCILVGVNFDLRINQDGVSFESWFAFFVAYGAYLYAVFGLLFSCWILYTSGVLTPVVRETAKVTSMVFTILIGSQLLNLVVISFGGEHYIQQFLKSFDNELTVFLIVMLVLFVLGFVLDFLEIIYIVIPIVGPVIYGGTFDPKWVTIMIAVNLQTSFLTPPFGFALFYLRGVAPASVTTAHIYRGIIPFVLIQVAGLAILWFFPSIVTIVPDLIPN
ncbi:TRAP transporter large permease subunit [Sulfitobacter mediterraneus]|uniref:TRAP transporter large permease n=1 Tax=Sulfitobacter mediterraneus TaxID=83219 RepID=UPI00193ADFB4|nr:TRAP transporter large permease subunit [Sulfitobacter mediterraneus]MBM1556776.1 TRAP transporter large permease subunit [Sulfitobacter mediterraneus]MBM1568961.1 TRAP transporter large permease subunit [Sulfitobacter mediterraneus]MBM1572388.1 TRAP transporter large permease subunit [Sulfitobacter mediterraneus]MBM1576551.1 TRAP transporter large permease subunit [Sulfitobacter mediterraneus]MBM1579734.1 TRAP transporter large permease subunit [Sulfitobacter mediterraneus]